MPLSIGVHARVTGHCNQGGRKYMEDMFSVAYEHTPDDKDVEYAFFGIFDGHGGSEAATFAREHLMNMIMEQKNFWSDRDEDVIQAIRDGYVNTHHAMWRELDKWPRTSSGLPSTAGTTASIAFLRRGKIYIGHVGDSGIILGYQVEGEQLWRATALTKDHKPENGQERNRIQEAGGKVVSKSGVPRVVWNRPRIGHKGPIRRSTHIDEIPFLAVARSLGDLWSYNSESNTFVVSPEPDVQVITIDVKSHRCLIFGTDGLWNMLTPEAAVSIVQAAERHNEKHLIASRQTGNKQGNVHMWINPSKNLVDRALERWSTTKFRADNTSVVTVMLDPPTPSRNENPPKKDVAAPVFCCDTIIPDPVDLKKPDSSNDVSTNYEACVENSPASKTIDENPLETMDTDGIQVAEVSSSEIMDESESKADGIFNASEELFNDVTKEEPPCAELTSLLDYEDITKKPPLLSRRYSLGLRSTKSFLKSRTNFKHRHTTISKIQQEPIVKRRTRSEDRYDLTDENDPSNEKLKEINNRLSWPVTGQSSTKNNFQRRNLGKKVKNIRRFAQLRRSFGLRDCNRSIPILMTADPTMVTQRWLRSDTMAATPVKTLRSRNVDITGHTISAQLVHHYGIAKPNRLKNINSTNGTNPNSGIGKRVKSLFNPSTRSRIKRLGK